MEDLNLDIDPGLLYILTLRLYQAGSYDDARDCATYLRQIDPSNARSYKILGNINQASGQYSWAIGAYQRAFMFNAMDTDALLRMAQCHAYLKEYDWAISRLNGCLAIDPDHQEAKEMLKSLKKEQASQ